MESDRPRAPNIRDVAARAGVSYQTVSRVLNDSPAIRPETRARVLTAIQELGYRPNQAARALVTSRSRAIGVLSSQPAFYGPSTSIAAIESAARAEGYRISTTYLVSADRASIESGLQYLFSQGVEAIVVLAPQVRVFEALEELAVAVPYVGLSDAGGLGHRVAVDQVEGGRRAIRHLAELGHSEILHIAGPQDWTEADSRMQGYLRALDESDLRPRAPVLGDWTASFGYYAGLELLRMRDFTAVFAANDQMALGFLHACRDAGLDVPGDVSVVGFDDIPEAAHLAPPLTTVRQDFAELGRRAVAQLLRELRGEAAVESEPIIPELVVRGSTARPR